MKTMIQRSSLLSANSAVKKTEEDNKPIENNEVKVRKKINGVKYDYFI